MFQIGVKEPKRCPEEQHEIQKQVKCQNQIAIASVNDRKCITKVQKIHKNKNKNKTKTKTKTKTMDTTTLCL